MTGIDGSGVLVLRPLVIVAYDALVGFYDSLFVVGSCGVYGLSVLGCLMRLGLDFDRFSLCFFKFR